MKKQDEVVKELIKKTKQKHQSVHQPVSFSQLDQQAQFYEQLVYMELGSKKLKLKIQFS